MRESGNNSIALCLHSPLVYGYIKESGISWIVMRLCIINNFSILRRIKNVVNAWINSLEALD